MTRQILISTIFLSWIVLNVCGQAKGDEGFEKLKDSVLIKEIAFFTISGSIAETGKSFTKTKVNEIPLVICTDSSAYFEKGNLYASEIIVSINSEKFDTTAHTLTYVNTQSPSLELIDNKPFWGTDGNIPKEKLKEVRFVHVKYQLLLPETALHGLYEPNFCYKDKTGKQSAFCKVFRSTDKRRVYIYMLNSDGAGGYEVTWVIQDSKYLTRVIDYGF